MTDKTYKDHLFLLSVIALLMFYSTCISAQELNKEVYVVRPYEPTLSEASKFNFLPQINDIETTTPGFKYSISPKRLENGFSPEPIKAAKTVTTSLPKIYNSWLKLGLGNYSTPLVEFNISNLRSKDYAYGAYLHHKSSHSSLRLANDDKISAPYVENNMVVYGKRFFKEVTLSGDLRFDQYAFNYYGYNTEIFPQRPDFDKDSIRQKVYIPGIDIDIKSNYTDSQKLNYHLNADYDYFIDKLKNKESNFILRSSFSKSFNGLIGGLDLTLDHSKMTGSEDTLSNTLVSFNPWISKSSEDWQFKAGFEAVADIADITHYYFYPKANLDIIIVKDVLVPFVGISGQLQKNSFEKLFAENNFVKPGISLKNTSNNFILYGGLKGNITNVIRFRADASLTIFKNYHFFVNDTTDVFPLLQLENQFIAVYDDINLITYHGQLAFAPSDKFELMLDGKYFDYRMIEEDKPWHQPDFTIDADAFYKLNKLVFKAGVNIIGNRWIKNSHMVAGMKKLKPVFDGNMGVEYHYSKLLTVFAEMYNMAERSYLLWNQYPSQRFNFLFGFSYKL